MSSDPVMEAGGQSVTKHDDLLARFLADRGELLGYLRCLVPADLIDDVFQETFLVLNRRLGDFDRGRDFSAWVRGIARNVARQARDKREIRVAPLSDDLVADLELVYAEPVDDAYDLDLTHLRVCLDQLGPSQRDLLRRRYHANQSLAELAHDTERTPGAVQVALSRLRAILFACIQKRRKMPT